MNRLNDKVRRIIIVSICTSLLICLLALLLYGKSKENNRNQKLAELQEKTAPLEKQIEEINEKLQLIDLQTTNAEIAYVNIAFYLNKLSDFDIISDIEKNCNINGAAIVDITADNATKLITKAKELGSEVILTAPMIDDASKSTTQTFKSTLDENDASCFFVQSARENQETIQSLKDVGFDGVMRYSAEANDERYDNGLVTYGYIYFGSDGLDVNSKLSAYITNKQSAGVIVDMHNYNKGISQDGIETLINTIKDTETAGDVKVTITSSLITTINNIKDIDEESNNDIKKYKETLKAQLSELKSQVDEINKQWYE